jgi:hypothetical protein
MFVGNMLLLVQIVDNPSSEHRRLTDCWEADGLQAKSHRDPIPMLSPSRRDRGDRESEACALAELRALYLEFSAEGSAVNGLMWSPKPCPSLPGR